MAKLPKEITDEIYQYGYVKGYHQGRADGAREFAKFLIDKGIDVVDLHAEFQEGRINND